MTCPFPELDDRLTPEQRRTLAAGLKRAEAEGWSDQVRHAQDAHAVAEGCYFDPRFADHAEQFFANVLRHGTGRFAGKPFVLLDWQRDDIIRPMFGWRRPDGSRRHRSAFIYIPKKNGKSTLAAGITHYLLVAEPDPTDLTRTEQAQEVYCASTSADVGAIVYREAKKLVQWSPTLRKRLRCLDQTRRIVDEKTGSFFRVLPHKATSAEGMIAGGIICDEVHAMRDGKLYAALRYAGASRTQPLTVEITTAGIDDPALHWMKRLDYARRVADATALDLEHLVALYEADLDAAIDDIEQLRKANPSAGETIQEADLLASARQAMQQGPQAVNDFKRYRMNIAVGAREAWIAPEVWDKGQRPFDLDAMRGVPGVAGLDLAKVSDFNALCLLWRGQTEADPWHAAFWFWIAQGAIDQRAATGDASFQKWADEGLITATPGETTDHHAIRHDINQIFDRFDIEQLGIDRGFEGWQFAEDLLNQDELPVVGIGQGWKSQDVPMQRIERLAVEGRLNAGGNPVIRWMIGNARAERVGSNGNYKLNRERSSDKIDGVAALVNAMFLAESQPEDDGWVPSVAFV